VPPEGSRPAPDPKRAPAGVTVDRAARVHVDGPPAAPELDQVDDDDVDDPPPPDPTPAPAPEPKRDPAEIARERAKLAGRRGALAVYQRTRRSA